MKLKATICSLFILLFIHNLAESSDSISFDTKLEELKTREAPLFQSKDKNIFLTFGYTKQLGEFEPDDETKTIGIGVFQFPDVDVKQNKIFTELDYYFIPRLYGSITLGIADLDISDIGWDNTDISDKYKMYLSLGLGGTLYKQDKFEIQGLGKMTFYPTYDDSYDITYTDSAVIFANNIAIPNFPTSTAISISYNADDEVSMGEFLLGAKFIYSVNNKFDLYATPILYGNVFEWKSNVTGEVTDIDPASATFGTTLLDDFDVDNDHEEKRGYGLILGSSYTVSGNVAIGLEINFRSKTFGLLYLTVGL